MATISARLVFAKIRYAIYPAPPWAHGRLPRTASGDLRISIDARYRGVDDFTERIRAAMIAPVRHLLQ